MLLALANVEGHLATGLDHFTILINISEVSLQPKPTSRPLLRSPEDIQYFLQLIKEGAKDIPAINLLPAPANVDLLAISLLTTIQSALYIAGRPAKRTSRSALWWTKECAVAALEYRQVRRAFPLGFFSVGYRRDRLFYLYFSYSIPSLSTS